MREQKRLLREETKLEIEALPPEYVAESDAAMAAAVMALPEYITAKRVFAYWSVGRECDTRAIIRRALFEGKLVALPVSERGGAMTFRRYSGELVPGLLGIPAPAEGQVMEPESGELMLTPALLCDEDGFRLGHGGGYYDRYLAGRSCFSLCLCRERLLMKKVPRDWNDLPVSAVITEERLIPAGRK